jgi:hypothetical protein
MSRTRGSIPCPRDPVGLSLDEAATLFARMVADGRMPAPHKADGRRIWDADEVISAFRHLPRDLPAGAAHDDDGPTANDREIVL